MDESEYKHLHIFSVQRVLIVTYKETFLFSALLTQLNQISVKIPPDRFRFCSTIITILSVATGCSTWFILVMTFERFYSIIRPHKAASFNTVRKARVIILCITVIRGIYCVPHFFTTIPIGNNCVPYVKYMEHPAGKLFYWLDFISGFGFPFIALLIMNSVIIHTLRKRSSLLTMTSETQGQGRSEGQNSSKMKSSERQIIIMLLLVTFGFLILLTPSYVVTFCVAFLNISSSPRTYAGYRLFESIGQKTYFHKLCYQFLFVCHIRKQISFRCNKYCSTLFVYVSKRKETNL